MKAYVARGKAVEAMLANPEQWLRDMLRKGQEEQAIKMVKKLPDALKRNFRDIWKRVASERKRGSP